MELLNLLLGGLMVLVAPYEMSFRACGIKHGVPSWLMKGLAHETSHFRADAHGPTHDWGVLQVIESNAPGCGLAVSDLIVPAKNICCASWLMDRNLKRVRALGARGADAYKLSIARNNLGGGNVDSVIAAGATTWDSFKAATPQWPNKHDWVEKLWTRAQSYRIGEYIVNGLLIAGLGSLTGASWFAFR